MRSLDETDLEILHLLSEDGRRAYSEIADHVGLTPPAVSDRVARLEDEGIIRGFTVDVDRSALERSLPVVLTLVPDPQAGDEIYEAATQLEGVEHVFEGLDGTVLVHATLPDRDVRSWLASGLDLARIVEYDVVVLERSTRSTGLFASGFSLECVLCGKETGADGVTASVDGEPKRFCCETCKSQYMDRYEHHQKALE